MSYNKKHQKRKKRKFTLFFVIVVLFCLLLVEGYLIFYNPNNLIDSVNENSKETIPTEAMKEEKILTTNAEEAENFQQEITPTSDLGKQIDQDLQNGDFIGTALIIKDKEILLQKGYGYSNVSQNKKNNYASLYQIGSIQKGMTATLIAQQIQKGTLTLEETLDKFYPTVPLSNQITIKQLLSMTSGLIQGEKPTTNMSDEDFLSLAITNAKMGTYGQYKYDAINYYLLVGILEQLTGNNYRALFNQTFIQKVPLSHTMFYNDFLSATNRTYEYAEKDNKNYSIEIQDTPLTFNQEVGTGNIGMSVGDLYLYYSSWLKGKFFDRSLINTIWEQNDTGSYMGGIYNYPDYFRSRGTEGGFETLIYMTKDSSNAVILFTNQYPKDSSYQDLTLSIFKGIHPI